MTVPRQPMPTVPQRDGWKRGAIRIARAGTGAFMGLIDPNGEPWEAYYPLSRSCRPGTASWRSFERSSAPERAEWSNYQHALVEVDGEWWYAERFMVDGRSNLEAVHGLEALKVTDHWKRR